MKYLICLMSSDCHSKLIKAMMFQLRKCSKNMSLYKKLPHLATREKKMKEIMIENLKNAMDYCM